MSAPLTNGSEKVVDIFVFGPEVPEKMAEVASWFGGKMVARLNDAAKTELPLARDRVKSLRERLGFWTSRSCLGQFAQSLRQFAPPKHFTFFHAFEDSII